MTPDQPPSTATGDEAPLPPSESLALIEQQSLRTRRDTDVNPALFNAAWGTAWLLGFGFFYLGAGPAPPLDVPTWVVGVTFAALLTTAGLVQIVHSARATRGVHGVSAQTGAMYGWTWTLGLVSLAIVLSAVTAGGVSDRAEALLWPAAFVLVAGILLMAGGTVFRDWLFYGLGVWIVLVDVAAALAGIPTYYLVVALAGGGGFLVVSALHQVRRSRTGARA